MKVRGWETESIVLPARNMSNLLSHPPSLKREKTNWINSGCSPVSAIQNSLKII